MAAARLGIFHGQGIHSAYHCAALGGRRASSFKDTDVTEGVVMWNRVSGLVPERGWGEIDELRAHGWDSAERDRGVRRGGGLCAPLACRNLLLEARRCSMACVESDIGLGVPVTSDGNGDHAVMQDEPRRPSASVSTRAHLHERHGCGCGDREP